jgi:transcriptional regulator with XRE-family HTH domain
MPALTQSKVRELRHRPVSKAGNRLADAIDLSGQTSTAIGEALGFTLQYVSDVSRGRWQTITVDNAHKFAEFFGCAIEDLFPAREAVAS